MPHRLKIAQHLIISDTHRQIKTPLREPARLFSQEERIGNIGQNCPSQNGIGLQDNRRLCRLDSFFPAPAVPGCFEQQFRLRPRQEADKGR